MLTIISIVFFVIIFCYFYLSSSLINWWIKEISSWFFFQENNQCFPQTEIPVYNLSQMPKKCQCKNSLLEEKKCKFSSPEENKNPSNQIFITCGGTGGGGCGGSHYKKKDPCEDNGIGYKQSVIWHNWKYVIGCLPNQIDRYAISCDVVDLSSHYVISHSYGKIISLRVEGENKLILTDNRATEIISFMNPVNGNLYF